MAAVKIKLENLFNVDETGMPKPPTLRQILDKDIRELYLRDNTKDKIRYTQEAIVIYYIGDPKSPANQSGLTEAEALKMAIEQAGLKQDYIPDSLVIRLIKKYHDHNIGEAGRVVENMLKGIHNVNLTITQINRVLSEKLSTNTMGIDDIANIMKIVDNVNEKAAELPKLLRSLKDAKQNLMYEEEQEVARGGQQVLSSMDAEDYM